MPFNPNSPWNTPLPASPTLASNSAAIVTKINSWSGPAALVAGTYNTADDFDIPVYYASTSDPLFTISVGTDVRSYQVNGASIHIPNAAKPSGGSDHHMMVVDPTLGWVYELYDVTSKPSGGGTLVASTGGRVRYNGDGFGNPNAMASKTGAIVGLVTAAELTAAVIPHAVNLIMKSSDGTAVWPASGLAGTTDSTNAPPCGSWFQLNMTVSAINTLASTYGFSAWKTAYLVALATYGGVFVDTSGSGSWNARFFDDTSTASLGGAQPVEAFAAAHTSADFSYSGTGTEYYGDLKSHVDWTKLQVIDPTYLKGLYAPNKYDAASDVSNNWGLTGGTTAHACLTETTYAPFAADATLRIGTGTVGHIAEVVVSTITVPTGMTLTGLILWYYGNTASGTTYTVDLRSTSTVLGTYTQPANLTYAWRAVEATSLSGINLADIRMRFTLASGSGFSNVRAAHVQAEFTSSGPTAYTATLAVSTAPASRLARAGGRAGITIANQAALLGRLSGKTQRATGATISTMPRSAQKSLAAQAPQIARLPRAVARLTPAQVAVQAAMKRAVVKTAPATAAQTTAFAATKALTQMVRAMALVAAGSVRAIARMTTANAGQIAALGVLNARVMIVQTIASQTASHGRSAGKQLPALTVQTSTLTILRNRAVSLFMTSAPLVAVALASAKSAPASSASVAILVTLRARILTLAAQVATSASLTARNAAVLLLRATIPLVASAGRTVARTVQTAGTGTAVITRGAGKPMPTISTQVSALGALKGRLLNLSALAPAAANGMRQAARQASFQVSTSAAAATRQVIVKAIRATSNGVAAGALGTTRFMRAAAIAVGTLGYIRGRFLILQALVATGAVLLRASSRSHLTIGAQTTSLARSAANAVYAAVYPVVTVRAAIYTTISTAVVSVSSFAILGARLVLMQAQAVIVSALRRVSTRSESASAAQVTDIIRASWTAAGVEVFTISTVRRVTGKSVRAAAVTISMLGFIGGRFLVLQTQAVIASGLGRAVAKLGGAISTPQSSAARVVQTEEQSVAVILAAAIRGTGKSVFATAAQVSGLTAVKARMIAVGARAAVASILGLFSLRQAGAIGAQTTNLAGATTKTMPATAGQAASSHKIASHGLSASAAQVVSLLAARGAQVRIVLIQSVAGASAVLARASGKVARAVGAALARSAPMAVFHTTQAYAASKAGAIKGLAQTRAALATTNSVLTRAGTRGLFALAGVSASLTDVYNSLSAKLWTIVQTVVSVATIGRSGPRASEEASVARVATDDSHMRAVDAQPIHRSVQADSTPRPDAAKPEDR